ncbi:DUF3870 domain-containing protein [Oceanobacillus damuensis]|uniref:DUF3870 domain-containing protein n=1 Tax=Oceanobacillus damuensis TaxID=937928 RepID=UPI000834A906|nr:DUF3870 domain-containing protein [Oceanobacillus damuensis]
MNGLKTVLVTGYAKAPQGTSMYENYKHAGIILVINTETNKIENASFTFISELTTTFFQNLLVGYDLSNGLDELIKRIQNHYLAPSQQAVIVALKSAAQRYWDHKNEDS